MSQKDIKIFEYNGYEFEFDLADADASEKYENAVEIMAEEEKGVPKAGKLSVIYRAQCGLIKRFLDNTLGEGAGNKLCGEKDNITNCYATYSAFLDFVSAQRDTIIASKNVISKYSNRAQRRAADKKK